MDEGVLYAALVASPVIFPYSFFVGGTWSFLLSFLTCVFTVPTCAFMNCSLRGKKPSYAHPLMIPICLPLALILLPSQIEWNFSSLLVTIFGSLIGIRMLLSVSDAPLKVPLICVSTRRRVAHAMASQLFPHLLPKIGFIAIILGVSVIITLPLSTNFSNFNIVMLLWNLVSMTVMMNVFYNTCLEATRLFMTLPPLRLNGRRICEGLAKKDKLAYWETSLFIASGRGSREFVWEISPIGGRIINWGTMVEPALQCLREATTYLEKNRAKRSDKFNWRKQNLVELPQLEQVLWSLDSIGTLVYHAYNENRNGVTQVHFRPVMETLFMLESASQGNGPQLLQDRIRNTLYKICTKYASALHSIDIDSRYQERFVTYSDFKV